MNLVSAVVVYGYAAQITLEGDRGGESATFYLTNLNAPTSSLVGENTYTLAAIWETDVQGFILSCWSIKWW